MDSCGRLWTPMDTAWRFTDQKVGDSSPSGRAAEVLVLQGVHVESLDLLTLGSHPSVDVGSSDFIVVVQSLPIGWLGLHIGLEIR